MLQSFKRLGMLAVLLAVPTTLATPDIYSGTLFIQNSEYPFQCSQLSHMTPEQRTVIAESYEIGSKHDLGLTLAALAWEESNAGLFTVNTKTHDYGVYQIHLKTAMSREGKSGEFNRNVIASKLVNDMEFAAKHAIMEIHGWQKAKGRNPAQDVFASYNGGWKGPTIERSQKYAVRVKTKIKTLQACLAEGGYDAPSRTVGNRIVEVQNYGQGELSGRDSGRLIVSR